MVAIAWLVDHTFTLLSETIKIFQHSSSFEKNSVHWLEAYQGLQWLCLAGFSLVLLLRAGRASEAGDCSMLKCFINLV